MGCVASSLNSHPSLVDQRPIQPTMQLSLDYERGQDRNQSQNQNQVSIAIIHPSVISLPGAYCINHNETAAPELFHVHIPNNVGPNQEFHVDTGFRGIVPVRCPPNTRPDQRLTICLPPEDMVTRAQGIAVLTSADGSSGGGAVRMNSETRLVNSSIANSDVNNNSTNSTNFSQPQQTMQAYNVQVPYHARPYEPFAVSLNGRTMQVLCPPTARPGMTVQIRLSTGPPPGVESATSLNRPPEAPTNNQPPAPRTETIHQTFEVTVPNGVRPNQPFSLMAGGKRVLVTCPHDARPGSRIRFQLPITVPDTSPDSGNKPVQQGVALRYDTQDGWIRTVSVSDMRFRWIKLDQDGEIVSSTNGHTFDVKNSAFVRKLVFLQGNDKRMRTGKLSLMPTSEYSVDSEVVENGKKIVTSTELSEAQTMKFNAKTEWFQKTCKKLGVPWDEGHVRIVIRREYLISDSVNAVMSLGREDLRKIWRFEFMGEMGIDAGGLTKEWFLLVSQAIFNADSGLWVSSEGNQMLMRINPSSEISCPEDHLIYFRFLGRVLGKAIFDGQIVAGHMVQYLYKYMLGWPITYDDVESVDTEIYNNLKQILDMPPDQVEHLALDFTTTQNFLGESSQVDLVKDGANKDVTGDNLHEYLEVYFKYLMLERIRPQVTELLLGFYDVVPEQLLTVFDYQELELIMCGLPSIDIDDWIEHTQYKGTFESKKASNVVCKWFWEIVREEFDEEMRARLLQFATGTSGVPSRGFSTLQGNNGNIKLFTLNGIEGSNNAYPTSHTCFNRLDLPKYRSKNDLRDKLKIAVRECATGFQIE